MKTLKNKLYAIVLLICGYLPVLIDKDATALVFFAFIMEQVIAADTYAAISCAVGEWRNIWVL